jgi:hypothetical protein
VCIDNKPESGPVLRVCRAAVGGRPSACRSAERAPTRRVPVPEDFPLECREDGEQTGVVNSTATALYHAFRDRERTQPDSEGCLQSSRHHLTLRGKTHYNHRAPSLSTACGIGCRGRCRVCPSLLTGILPRAENRAGVGSTVGDMASWREHPRYIRHREGLVKALQRPKYRFRVMNPVIFLCGAKDSEGRDAIRNYFKKHHPTLNVFYAEKVWDIIATLGETDALQMEAELVRFGWRAAEATRPPSNAAPIEPFDSAVLAQALRFSQSIGVADRAPLDPAQSQRAF